MNITHISHFLKYLNLFYINTEINILKLDLVQKSEQTKKAI